MGIKALPHRPYSPGLPWGLLEVVGTVQVHCSRRRLLRKGLEFHVCTINKSAHTKNVWKLIVLSPPPLRNIIDKYIYNESRTDKASRNNLQLSINKLFLSLLIIIYILLLLLLINKFTMKVEQIRWGLEYADCIPRREVSTPTHKGLFWVWH